MLTLREFVPHPYQSLNTDGEILTVNDAWIDIVGYDRETVEGRWFGEFLVDDSVEVFESRFAECKSTESVSNVEIEMECADGDTIIVSYDGTAEYDDGDFVRAHCQFADITDQKEREQKINRQAKSLNYSSDVVSLLNEQGVVEYQSDQHPRSEWPNAHDFEGEKPVEYVHPEDTARVREAFENLIENPDRTEITEFRLQTTEGNWRWIENRAQNFLDDPDIDGILVCSRDITDRKERERQIKELKDRLELAVEGAKLGVWDWDMTTDEVEFNEQWAQILGFSRAEIEPHLEAWKKRVHTEDLDDVEQALEAHMAGEEDYYATEHRMRTAGGDWKWIRDVGKIVERNEDGDPVRAVGIHIDIDERKAREAELTRQKERAEQFFETAGNIMLVLNRDGTVARINERGSDLLGYERSELVGSDWFDHVVPEQIEGEIEDIFSAFWNDDAEPIEKNSNFIESKGGEKIFVKWHNTALRDPEGYVTGVLSSGIDITERKEKNRQIAQIRDFLDEIIEALPYPLYVLDTDDYEIERSNMEGGDLNEETCYSHSHQRTRPCHTGETSFPCPLEAVVETGEPITVEHTHYGTDGDELVHEVHAAPIFDDEGTVVQMVESLIDITSRKEYERQLEGQRDSLEVLNQVLRHDIRNDLQLVTAYADILANTVTDENREYVQTIQENARHAVELTTTARDMADVWLSDTDEQIRIALKATLENELDEIRSAHTDSVVTVDGTIPDVTVLANDMLNSVFRNVLQNAIRHNNSDMPTVTVSVEEREETVEVRVADNGPGVPDNQKSTIFGKGEKGLGSSGTGLGLYLVKTLMESYDGAVWVEDNEPEGAVFVVELQHARVEG